MPPTQAALRAFIRTNTRLAPVAGAPGLVLHQGGDVNDVWGRAAELLGQNDPPIPFWAFPWAGGLAVVEYLAEHPGEVAGKQVVDLASGSGLCAIWAMKLGAASAHAIDVDPISEQAVWLNSRANGVHVGFSSEDALGGPLPECDVLIAGDVCYEETMAERMTAWLRKAAAAGIRILLGDPGRAYLPTDLRLLGTYEVQAAHQLESLTLRTSSVYTFTEDEHERTRRA